MEFVVVTGLSGAGKTQAMHSMEDIGFFCVDNLPPALIPVFYDLCVKSEGAMGRVAVVTDTRGGELFKSFFTAMETLKQEGKPYKTLFLDASDEVLVRRFKETRRKHPLDLGGSLEQAVRLERDMLGPMRGCSDYVIDTTACAPARLKGRIAELFLACSSDSMPVFCVSFGFKFGIPMEADLVFDVRCLPNPFYVPELKSLTGMNQEVRDYVMGFDESRQLMDKLQELISLLLPLYQKEGKSQVTIAFGCTGGQHRSVTFAELMHQYISRLGYFGVTSHRDAGKEHR